jgi:hypothetical protein
MGGGRKQRKTKKQIVQKSMKVVRLCVSVMLTFGKICAALLFSEDSPGRSDGRWCEFLMKWGGRERGRDEQLLTSALS